MGATGVISKSLHLPIQHTVSLLDRALTRTIMGMHVKLC